MKLDLGGFFSAKKLMGFDEFMCMVSDLALIEPSFTHREVRRHILEPQPVY